MLVVRVCIYFPHDGPSGGCGRPVKFTEGLAEHLQDDAACAGRAFRRVGRVRPGRVWLWPLGRLRQLRLIRWAADGSDPMRAARVELRRGANGRPAIAVPAVSAEAGLRCRTSGPHRDRQWIEGSGRDEARGEPLGRGADGALGCGDHGQPAIVGHRAGAGAGGRVAGVGDGGEHVRSGPGGSAATALRNWSWSVWVADVVRARSNIGVSVGAGSGWSDVSLRCQERRRQSGSTRCCWCFPHKPARVG